MASTGFRASSADAELVDAARAGSRAAFDILVDRHHEQLLSFFVRRTGNLEEASDLVQDTFAEAYRCLYRLDGDHRFAQWLYGIANNLLKMHKRRRLARRLVSLEWLPSAVLAAHPALQIEDAADDAHERDAVHVVLADMSPAIRQALLLHGEEGRPASEVARILGVSVSAAERRISRAKTEFRRRYLASGGGPGDGRL